MKKMFIIFILFILTACQYNRQFYFGTVKNLYYDDVFIHSSKNNILYIIEKGESFASEYNPVLYLQEENNTEYFIYKDKEKREFITSFFKTDFIKVGNTLSFDESGVFKIEK